MQKRMWVKGIAMGLFLLGTMLHATSYYVDSHTGNDANPGTSSSKPWLTLSRINTGSFKAGDKILLHAGGVWSGQLAPPSSGVAGSPIVIDRYGSGQRPRLNGEGKVDDVIYLHNLDEIEVRNLEVTNKADMSSIRRGVDILLDNFGIARHIVVADLYIHDIRGTNERKDNGGIIFRTMGNRVPSRFDGLLIERNIVWRVDRSAIAAESYHAMRSHWFPSLHVVIRDNYVEDVGGDGIVPWATEGAIIEHNIARYCNSRAGSFNAGIWPWSTDNSTFQLNEAAFTQTTKDGEGFDSDYNSKNTLFKYNYSHDNVGGFMLICTPVKRNQQENLGNSGTVIEHNISRNDHTRIFNLSGADHTTVEDNTIYVGPGDDVQVLLVSNWDGWSNGAMFHSNTFDVAGTGRYGHEVQRNDDGTYRIASGWGGASEIQFDGNRYFGHIVDIPPDPTAEVDSIPHPMKLDWLEPVFDPAHPDAFPAYLTAHRAWMVRLFTRQFGEAPRLQTPDAGESQ
jgi:hypothetical protein